MTQAIGKKASRHLFFSRLLAKAIDLVVVVALAALLPYPLGPLLGFFYSLGADGMGFSGVRGQSLGKKIVGLRVVRFQDSSALGGTERRAPQPARLMDSVYRNAPVGVATFFALIPIWGWLILALIGLPLLIMEIYLMITVASGHRLGDVMGGTEVIEIRDSKG